MKGKGLRVTVRFTNRGTLNTLNQMQGIMRSAPGAPVASPHFWLEVEPGRHYYIPWTSVEYVALEDSPAS